ncbi:MAG: cyclic nucleotide-binding domain-containing protein [bacterium]
MITQGVGRTDIGRKRDLNEDVFHLDNDVGVYVVCDGMGGHAAGEVAASTAVTAVREFLSERRDRLEACRRQEEPVSLALRLAEEAIQHANQQVWQLARQELKYRGMGCTITLVISLGYQAVMAHVGHTRLFLFRDGTLSQLSAEHTLVAELIRAGAVELAKRHESAHATTLTRVVGLQESVEADTLVVDLLAGDLLLLCSDGLTRGLESVDELGVHLAGEFESSADALVEEANTRGGQDNITAVVVRVLTEGDEDAPIELVAEVGRQLDLLSAVPLFANLSFARLQRVRNLGRVLRVDADDTVVEQGEVVEELFLVLSGKLSIEQNEVHHGTLREGDTFGELNLVCRRPSEVSLVAAKPSTLLVIERGRFRKLIHRRPWLGVDLLEELFRLTCKRGIPWP